MTASEGMALSAPGREEEKSFLATWMPWMGEEGGREGEGERRGREEGGGGGGGEGAEEETVVELAILLSAVVSSPMLCFSFTLHSNCKGISIYNYKNTNPIQRKD